ncbi:hypothetical protein JKF63_06150 [Porcisia hertigi]|uniref:Protein kinase n=1 Tax=Porcisia hertigi TaxID=2761500 RepID=A0A836IWP5_9TRYP|nr:hypothetical protein JKF63_06150 [Porcisia hertigi]
MNPEKKRLGGERQLQQTVEAEGRARCDTSIVQSMCVETSPLEPEDANTSTSTTSSAQLPLLAPLSMALQSVITPATATTGLDPTPHDDPRDGDEKEEEVFLTNGSIALAEFTSLLKPAENNTLKEHIIHLLQNVDTEETLVRIAQALETRETPVEVSSTTLTASSREAASYTNASQSTSASMNTTQRRRSSNVSRPCAGSFEALAGFSFLHPPHSATVASAQDPPSSAPPSEDAGLQNRLSRGPSGPMDASFNSRSSFDTRDEERRHSKQNDETLSTFMAEGTSQDITTTAPLLELPPLPTHGHIEGRRVAVSAAPCMPPPEMTSEGAPATALPPLQVVPKTAAEELQLRRILRRCHTFSSLETETLQAVVKAMDKEEHAAGVAILEQGKATTEKLYLVGEGTCEVIKNGKALGSLPPGGTFGELELMYKQAKCAATIRCVTRCVLYTLDDTSYHRVIMTSSLQKRRKFEQLTTNVPFLRCLPDFERMKIAEALETRVYKRGNTIIHFGSAGKYMHFIVEGEVKVIGRNRGRRVEVVRLRKGDVVGELEFLFNHLTVADVVATSREVRTACISREHFELIIGPIQDRLKEFVATSSTYEKYYVSEVADESVRTELNRIESSRKHRRVAWQDEETSIGVTDPRGEVLLSAPLALLRDKCATVSKSGTLDGAVADHDSQVGDVPVSPDVLEETVGDSARPPKALLRFPFAPITGKEVAVLALREDGLIIYWNSVLDRLTSYSAEEVVGQNIYSFLLSEREQQAMYKAISTARGYAGEADEFLKRPNIKSSQFTLARRDGLTKTTIRLTMVPPVVSGGRNAAEVVLGFGDEVKEGPQKMLEQPQWLSSQIRTILADGTQSFEERLECIAETLNNFESTYRAMTVSTERLRVVNIRQMMGHVLMDLGSECVTRCVSVRQCFEGLPSERAYLDANLLPECLRYAMKLCLKYSITGGSIITITITVTEKNGLEFLVVNFNLSGDGMPKAIAKFFDSPLNKQRNSSTVMSIDAGDDDDNSDGDDEGDDEGESDAEESMVLRHALRPRLRRKLRRVQRAVEDQGGTLRMLRNPQDSNIVFLIPFMPASEQDAENASVEESLSTLADSMSASQSVSLAGMRDALGHPTSGAAAGNVSLANIPAGESSGLSNLSVAGVTPAAPGQPSFSYTTCLAEDTPAHRVMLSSFLWERHHAVLTAFSFEDVLGLTGVADILIIDLQQSAVTFLQGLDPIARLRDILRHMAVIVTSTNFDLVSSDTYAAAGFITLKKPCTPVQAMKAIRRAEEKSAVMKLERMRIEQTRETLSRNSRGAWRRGALLGKGSFGEVYEAYDLLTGGRMAVKEMRLGNNDAKIEQFVQEISTMCNLQHPNIIHYFYCEESASPKVIRVFMEFAGGGTLQTLLKKKSKLEYVEMRALLRDIVEGLAYIHSQHYVHGDIKTANVLLSNDGKGKIGDFGTARTVQNGELLYVMQGSPLYMSPECMSAGEMDEDGTKVGYSFPSDIWSLGCVAMEMATNKPPFAHIKTIKGPAGLTKFITSLTDVPDLSPLFKCHASIVEFVSACLNPDPNQRATAQDLLQLSLFSESTHGDRNSAVKALKRAQLLHVLNKFVAFQEPQEAAEREKRRSRFKARRVVSDYFSSSSNSSRSPHSTNVSEVTSVPFSKSGPAAEVDGGADKRRRRGSTTATTAAAARMVAIDYNDDDESDTDTLRRSATMARAPDDALKSSDHAGAAHKSTESQFANTLTAADGGSMNPTSPSTRYLRNWDSSSSCSSSSSVRGNLTPTAMTAAGGDGSAPYTPALPVHHTIGVTDKSDDAEPDARNPKADYADDLSPTPTKRSKTRSRPRAQATPLAQMSLHGGRGHDSTSTANSAEDEFFATSSESGSDKRTRSTKSRTPNKAGTRGTTLSRQGGTARPPQTVTATSEGRPPTGIEGFGYAPSFPGRRRNVRLDEAGNIVPFERPLNNRSELHRDCASAMGGAEASAAVDTEANAVSHAPLPALGAAHDHALSPVGVMGGLASPPFAQGPGNFSFFNYSFNKNISFMGSNMDEVLNSAANDFLSNLVANSHASNVPGGDVTSSTGSTAPLIPKTFRRVEKSDSGRSHATVSTNREGEGHADGVSGEFATLASPKYGDEHGDMADTSSQKRGRALSRSPSARDPLDTRGQGDSTSIEGGNSREQNSEATVPYSHAPAAKPLSVVVAPPVASRSTYPASSNLCSASCTSDDVAASITPRDDSVPLLWAAASGYRHRRVRPPITNHSFFVVEDRSLPPALLRSNSTSVPPFLPNSDTTTMAGPRACGPASATQVSLTTSSSVTSGEGGVLSGARVDRDTGALPQQHYRNPAVVTPLPCFPTFATSHARAAWQQRQRGETGSGRGGVGDSSASNRFLSTPLSNDNSAYALPNNEHQRHEQSRRAAGAAMDDDDDDDYNSNDDVDLPSAAFCSVYSTFSQSASNLGAETLSTNRKQIVKSHRAKDEDVDTLSSEDRRSTGAPGTLYPSGRSNNAEADSLLCEHLRDVEKSLQNVLARLQQTDRQQQPQQLHQNRSEGGGLIAEVKESVDRTLLASPTQPTVMDLSPKAALHRSEVETDTSVSGLQHSSSSHPTPVIIPPSKQKEVHHPLMHTPLPLPMQRSHPLWSMDDDPETLQKGVPRNALMRSGTPSRSSTVHGASSGGDRGSVQVLLRRILRRLNCVLDEVHQHSLPTASSSSSPVTPEAAASVSLTF